MLKKGGQGVRKRADGGDAASLLMVIQERAAEPNATRAETDGIWCDGAQSPAPRPKRRGLLLSLEVDRRESGHFPARWPVMPPELTRAAFGAVPAPAV